MQIKSLHNIKMTFTIQNITFTLERLLIQSLTISREKVGLPSYKDDIIEHIIYINTDKLKELAIKMYTVYVEDDNLVSLGNGNAGKDSWYEEFLLNNISEYIFPIKITQSSLSRLDKSHIKIILEELLEHQQSLQEDIRLLQKEGINLLRDYRDVKETYVSDKREGVSKEELEEYKQELLIMKKDINKNKKNIIKIKETINKLQNNIKLLKKTLKEIKSLHKT